MVLVDEVDEEEGFAGGEFGGEADEFDVFEPVRGAETFDDALIEIGVAVDDELDIAGDDDEWGEGEFSEREEWQGDLVEGDLSRVGEDAIFAEEGAEPGEENCVGHAAEGEGEEVDDLAGFFSGGSSEFIGGGEIEEPSAHPLHEKESEAVGDPHGVGVGGDFSRETLGESHGDGGEEETREEVGESPDDFNGLGFFRSRAPVETGVAGHAY